MRSKDAADWLRIVLEATGLRPEREYRCVPGRRWRFDLAFPDHRVAIEVHGGVWTRGRHNRPQGFINDRQKMNAAALLGWLVLEYTTDDLKGRMPEVVNEITAAVSGDGMPTLKTRDQR